MPTRIDHVIIGAPDLDALERSFTAMGFSVTGGGSHPHLGTRNRIIILGEGYIELLAIADPANAS
ncbi:MAG TPA: VOC family protein, partial [Ktedonobacterales bacterium]